MSKQTFEGSCHCGAISYTFKLGPDARKAARCNCTWCQKAGGIISLTLPREDFKLVKPDSVEELGDYAPKNDETNFAHRYFCKTCATHVWREGQYEYPPGQVNKFFGINLNTVSQPQEGLDLKDFSYGYVDGLHDNFMAGEQDEPFSGGLR